MNLRIQYCPPGDWREAGVVRQAMELNHPVQAVAAGRHAGVLPAEHAWIDYQSKHVILDTVKASEDGTGTILRFYESSGAGRRYRPSGKTRM